MGKIKKILENELVGGTQTTDVYPVTSVKAVYDENNERLDNILNRRGVVNVSTNYNDDHIAEVLTLKQAIAKVPSSDRTLGFTMTFLSSNGWVTYQYTGDSLTDWSTTTNWDSLLHSGEVLQELGDSETAPMSQKAVSDNIGTLEGKVDIGFPYNPLGLLGLVSGATEVYINKFSYISVAYGVIVNAVGDTDISIVKFNKDDYSTSVIQTVSVDNVKNGINIIYFDSPLQLNNNELIGIKGRVYYYSTSQETTNIIKVTGVYGVTESNTHWDNNVFEIQYAIITNYFIKDLVNDLITKTDNIEKYSINAMTDTTILNAINVEEGQSILDLPDNKIYRTNNEDGEVEAGLPIKGFGVLLKYTTLKSDSTGYRVYLYNIAYGGKGNIMYFALTNQNITKEQIVWHRIADTEDIDNLNNLFNDVNRWLFEQTYIGAPNDAPFDSSKYINNSLCAPNSYFNINDAKFNKVYGVYIMSANTSSTAKLCKYSAMSKSVEVLQEFTPTKINEFEYHEFEEPITLDPEYEMLGFQGNVKYGSFGSGAYEYIGEDSTIVGADKGTIRKLNNVTIAYILVGDSIKDEVKKLSSDIKNTSIDVSSLKNKEIIGLRSNILGLNSSGAAFSRETGVWFNDFKPSNGKVTGIIFKNHKGNSANFVKVRCTELWDEIEEGETTPAGIASTDIVSVDTSLYEEGELVFVPVNVELADDEYIGMYGSLYFGTAANCGYTQRNFLDGRADHNYCIGYWLVTDIETPKTKYIEIFKDNFSTKDLFNWTFNGSWNVVEGGIQSGANGEGNYMRSNRIYHYDKRRMRLKFSCGSDSVIRAFCSYGSSMNAGNGATGIILDFVSKKLTLCKTGDGTDSQLWGATINFSEELTSMEFPDKFGDAGDYILEFEKDELNISCTVFDCKTGHKVYVTHEGWGAGRLNQYFGVCPMSGTSIILKEFTVDALYNPDIVVVGDSITEGEGTTDKTKKYCSRLRTDCPDKTIVLSSRGGDTINGVISKFYTEYLLVKPKLISILIGANMNNTTELLNRVIWLSKLIGAKVVFHYTSPQTNNDRMQANNQLIEALDEQYRGARFDMSLLTDNDPWITESHPSLNVDLSLYSDNYLHPNNDGHGEMYNRLKIDVPYFYN